MQFLDAAFLWAGFAVLIPPIIHLFNFRRYKTVYFSDIRFLQNLKNVTRQRSTIKQILLMVLRMFIIACLVIAFANPVVYKGGGNTTTRRSAPPIIYIDNSFSMQAGAMSGLNLETAKAKALEIVDAFPRETDFLFITNDFEQRHNRLVKSDAVRLFLQELQLTPVTPTISQVIDRAVGSLGFLDVEPECTMSIFLISDFQKNICDFDAIKPDSLLSVNLVGITSQNIGNVAVDTVEFLTPYRMMSGQEEALVSISNYGDKPVRGLPVKLYVNNSAKVSVTTDLNPHERRQVSLKYVNTDRKAVRGRISISDFPIDYDNDIFFAYHIDSVRNVLILGEPSANKYLRAMLGKDGNFAIDEVGNSAAQDVDLTKYKSVIINQLTNVPAALCSKVQAFVAGGGSVVFVPSFDGNIDGYNHLLSLLECNSIISRDTIRCKVQTVNTQSALLRGAVKQIPENPDLPLITRYFNSMSNSYQGEEVVLESDSYKKIMTANEYRAGNIYVFYTPLDNKSGNLYSHRLIVPLIYNAVATSRNMGQPYYSVIGRDNGFAVKIDGNVDVSKVVLRTEDGNEFIPKVSGPDAFMNYKFFSENCVRTPGFCDLVISGRQAGVLAYNYDRRESDLDFLTADYVAENLEGIGLGGVRVMNSGSQAFATEAVASATTKPLWKIFVVISLILAIGEIFVSRFF